MSCKKKELLTNPFSGNESFKKFLLQFEGFLKDHLKSFQTLPFKGQKQLKSAMEYSLFSGGKRFRPLLVFATAELMKIKTSVILPWAGAIEMLHTASLIHDDLPCMDNSLQRRGKATNHRLFGENMALLAGDCLWIEAFRLIGSREKESKVWINLLCTSAGFSGLMGGQALDLKIPSKPSESYCKKMHFMKTGALISASMTGVLALKPEEKTNHLKKISYLIGQAFQLSDDLQDEKEEKSPANFARAMGSKKARKDLETLSKKALELIKNMGYPSRFLKKLIIFNRDRAF